MNYRLPELCDRDMLAAYVREHFEHNENSISASLGLLAGEYSDWVAKIHRNADLGDAKWGRSLLYLCMDGEKLVGLLSIRYDLPEALTKALGDIGFGVRPTERRKGYATAMLRYALSVCKEKRKAQVLLGCYKENEASRATILKCGGVLVAENCNYNEEKISQYFAIEL